MSDSDAHPEIEARFTELAEGSLSAEEAARITAHLAGCSACTAAHADFQRTLAALSGLGRQGAPPGLPAGVADAIHRRSGGRFFGRRAFGDRVPFEVLALVALVLLVLLFVLLRGSTTGSLRLHRPPAPPPAATEPR